MNERNRHPGYETEPAAPQGLVKDLRALYGRSILVPESVDAAVIASARQALSGRRRRWVGVLSAAAAVFVLCVASVLINKAAEKVSLHREPSAAQADRAMTPAESPSSSTKGEPAPATHLTEGSAVGGAQREDVDGNGRVDILDAFALARRIEAGGPPAEAIDMNGDGAVDRDDVNCVAMFAVRLNQEGIR